MEEEHLQLDNHNFEFYLWSYLIHTSNGNKRRRETTKGWEVWIQYKDGSSTWNQVQDIKESFPAQLAEYAVINQIADELALNGI